MELIAASRIVRAQQAINAARPYVEKMAEVVAHLSTTPDGRKHPLFREPESIRKAAVVAIAGDRGLSGGYNAFVLRAADRLLRDHAAAGREVLLVTVGRKAGAYFRYRGREVAQSFTGMADRPTVDDATRVAAAITAPFEAGEIDEIDVVYTHFHSMARQTVETRKLVPLEPAPDHGDEPEVPGRPAGFVTDYEYEPDPAELLDRLAPSWLRGEILAALLSASASEYLARQRAMKAATDNAEDLITSLTRVMNRARQDTITTEIMEIVGGAEALRGGTGAEHAYNEIYERDGAA